jgi:uroporphyrin-3 C-methyltransferase
LKDENDAAPEPEAAEGPAEAAGSPEPASPPAKPQPKPDVPIARPVRAGRRGNAVAWLALLLALAAALVSGWLYYRSLGADSEGQGVRDEMNAALVSQRQEAAQQRRQNEAALDRLREELAALGFRSEERLNALQSALQTQRQRLLEINSTDRSDWMLAEAEYLLRLANQRLIMAADQRSALALLASADSILLELDDVGLYNARAAIARDTAVLRAQPRVDVEGTWLRLQALVGQVDSLVLFELPESQPRQESLAEDAGWRDRLEHGLSAALETLAGYVTIRRRDAPYEALLDPRWEGLVRQNLRMLLEQCRAALLSGNQVLYDESIANASRWIGEFFSFNEAGVQALQEELQALAGLNISQSYPSLTDSLTAIKAASNARHAIGAAPVAAEAPAADADVEPGATQGADSEAATEAGTEVPAAVGSQAPAEAVPDSTGGDAPVEQQVDGGASDS